MGIEAQILLVALIIGTIIGWLGRALWFVPKGMKPPYLLSSLVGIGGALIPFVLFPALVGGNMIITIIVALLGAAIFFLIVFAVHLISNMPDSIGF